MIKLIRSGCYYMNGALVKESQAYLTSEQKEKAYYQSIRRIEQKQKAPRR